MDTFVCPYCDKKVKLINYGDAWIGTCCDKIIYNERGLPRKNLDSSEDEGNSKSD